MWMFKMNNSDIFKPKLYWSVPTPYYIAITKLKKTIQLHLPKVLVLLPFLSTYAIYYYVLYFLRISPGV